MRETKMSKPFPKFVSRLFNFIIFVMRSKKSNIHRIKTVKNESDNPTNTPRVSHVETTWKRCFKIVLTWNTRGVFAGNGHNLYHLRKKYYSKNI